jgi:hypothetical protein
MSSPPPRVGISGSRLACLLLLAAIAAVTLLLSSVTAGAELAVGTCSAGKGSLVYNSSRTVVWAYGTGRCTDNTAVVTVSLLENGARVRKAVFVAPCARTAGGYAGPWKRKAGATYSGRVNVLGGSGSC